LFVQDGRHPALFKVFIGSRHRDESARRAGGVFRLTPDCVRVISLPSRLTGNEPLSILPLNSLPEENVGRAHYKLCDRLKLEKKQRRMCRRDPGVAETLREAITMSALECQYQFRFERWNCTLEGRHRANILKRGMFFSPYAIQSVNTEADKHHLVELCRLETMSRAAERQSNCSQSFRYCTLTTTETALLNETCN